MWIEQIIQNSETIELVVAGVLVVSLFVQLCYYLCIFRRLPAMKVEGKSASEGLAAMKVEGKSASEGLAAMKVEGEPASDGLPPVTVIICAKNEEENLRNHLPAFLQQDYPEYEVVVVNDCSTDNTEDVLMEMKSRFSHLRYTSIPIDKKFTHGKKLAVTIGIKSATYEHLLFSDADCYPANDQWIKLMASKFSDKTELVLGVGKYKKEKGLLNLVVRFETLFTAMQYLSYALGGRPYMGVGRNLAYKKDLFFRNKGFASHLKVLSGDDDLFVKEVSNKHNTAIQAHHDSYTISLPPANVSEWFKQKKRHLSTGKYYLGSVKRKLAGEYLSRMTFYFAFIFLLCNPAWLWISLGSYFILTTLKLIVLKLSMKKLNEQDLLLSSLFLDIFMPVILMAIKIANIFRPREAKWS